MVPRSVIDMIVGRLHVGESNLTVCKYLKASLRKGAWRKLTKRSRKAWLRQAIKCHAANRQLYTDVMSGRIGQGYKYK